MEEKVASGLAGDLVKKRLSSAAKRLPARQKVKKPGVLVVLFPFLEATGVVVSVTAKLLVYCAR